MLPDNAHISAPTCQKQNLFSSVTYRWKGTRAGAEIIAVFHKGLVHCIHRRPFHKALWQPGLRQLMRFLYINANRHWLSGWGGIERKCSTLIHDCVVLWIWGNDAEIEFVSGAIWAGGKTMLLISCPNLLGFGIEFQNVAWIARFHYHTLEWILPFIAAIAFWGNLYWLIIGSLELDLSWTTWNIADVTHATWFLCLAHN